MRFDTSRPKPRYADVPLSHKLSRLTKIGATLGTVALLLGSFAAHKAFKRKATTAPPASPVAAREREQAMSRPKAKASLLEEQRQHNGQFLKETLWRVYENNGRYGFSGPERKALAAVIHETGVPFPSLMSTLEVHHIDRNISPDYINKVLQNGTVKGKRENTNARIAFILAHVREQMRRNVHLRRAVRKIQSKQRWNSIGPAQIIWTRIQGQELNFVIPNADGHLHSAQQNWEAVGQLHLEGSPYFRYKGGRWRYIPSERAPRVTPKREREAGPQVTLQPVRESGKSMARRNLFQKRG